MYAQRVSMMQGWIWIRQGIWLFKRQPALLIALTVAAVLFAYVLHLLPIIGNPLVQLFAQLLLAGFLYLCHVLAQERDVFAQGVREFLQVGQQNATQLITLGGINLVCQLIIFGIFKLTGGAAIIDLMSSGAPFDPSVWRTALNDAGFTLLLCLVMFSILMMSMQFAPMLVVFEKMSPIKAMRISLQGFTLNLSALCMYSFMLSPIFLLAAVLVSISMLFMLPILFLLVPVMIASLYAVYRDIFPMVGDKGRRVITSHSDTKITRNNVTPPQEPIEMKPKHKEPAPDHSEEQEHIAHNTSALRRIEDHDHSIMAVETDELAPDAAMELAEQDVKLYKSIDDPKTRHAAAIAMGHNADSQIHYKKALIKLDPEIAKCAFEAYESEVSVGHEIHHH